MSGHVINRERIEDALPKSYNGRSVLNLLDDAEIVSILADKNVFSVQSRMSMFDASAFCEKGDFIAKQKLAYLETKTV